MQECQVFNSPNFHINGAYTDLTVSPKSNSFNQFANSKRKSSWATGFHDVEESFVAEKKCKIDESPKTQNWYNQPDATCENDSEMNDSTAAVDTNHQQMQIISSNSLADNNIIKAQHTNTTQQTQTHLSCPHATYYQNQTAGKFVCYRYGPTSDASRRAMMDNCFYF